MCVWCVWGVCVLGVFNQGQMLWKFAFIQSKQFIPKPLCLSQVKKMVLTYFWTKPSLQV